MKDDLPVQFALSWRLLGSRNLQPVIRRELEFPDGVSLRFHANEPQDPPIGVYERLVAAGGHPREIPADKGKASAWTWIAGRDDYLPSASPGIKRITEWIGYVPGVALSLFPNRARGELALIAESLSRP